jgi:flagellar biosynthesis component FlhA
VTGDPHTWVRHVMGDVEERVRRYLFRLVGVDEVDLWLEGWDSSHPDAPAWEQIDPVADRLRLARVLRLLLREQVSVRDRESIVAALRTSDESDARRGSETLDTLRVVRRAMGAAMLGIGTDDPVVDLPTDLEDRVAEGLRDDRAIWELPREGAHDLVSDLREWLAGLPDVPCAVVVADGRVRPFVWRLLASEQPVVRVLAAEEVS